MKKLLLLIFLLGNSLVHAQKGYVVNIAIDRIYVQSDSVKFPRPKTITLQTTGKSDTISVGKCGASEIGMCVVVRKVKAGTQVHTQVGYSFFTRNGSKWELIHNFGFTDRYALQKYSTKQKNVVPKEEYHCEYGVPVQFAAYFRMEVFEM